MYGKLIDGMLAIAPTKALKYVENGRHKLVLNPQKKHYLSAGYKEVEYDENTADGDCNTVYTETATKIKVSYA